MDTGIKKHIVAGILAYVDAGKTTLSESMLYLSGAIRKIGRVDHGNAFLDTYKLERERGITIFSKQAVFSYKDMKVTLLDTPGHVDFSSDMERTLQVIDYAILIISAADGVQGHTITLWRLLRRYDIPVFIFINKLDRQGTDRKEILKEIKKELSDSCVDFDLFDTEKGAGKKCAEALAVCDEALLDEYLKKGCVSAASVRRAVSKRKIFPCYSGSALKLTGVENFMEGLRKFTLPKEYPKEFGARVYKIFRDGADTRLTCLKVTGGALKVKDVLAGSDEKVNQIRIYSGSKYETVKEAMAGEICAVAGPALTYAGQGIGRERGRQAPVFEPAFNYKVCLPEGADVHKMYTNLKTLMEEEPRLNITWEKASGEIRIGLMGGVQADIMASLIYERFGVRVSFGDAKVLYKETISSAAEGAGHFEPLRHYAEVRLLLEPGQRGSGLVFDSRVSEDVLDRNWQRLILTHLKEKEHRGVLCGAPITDMKITLIAGRADKNHTEGGDFRQAAYRAVRQGLMKADSLLLEPWYCFRMEMPSEYIGRAIADIQMMDGRFDDPVQEGNEAVICGSAPVSKMKNYQKEFLSCTAGRGRIFLSPGGYEPCADQDRVAGQTGYDPQSDIANPSGSVFCSHGTSFSVPWDRADEYMDVESPIRDNAEKQAGIPARRPLAGGRVELTKEELDDIDKKTLESIKRNHKSFSSTIRAAYKECAAEDTAFRCRKEKQNKDKYFLVDGYNIIFAWDELKSLAERDVGAARGRLADILCNYQGYKGYTVILVFDAYKVENNPGESFRYRNIYVVYTKEAETADQYIEKTVCAMKRKYDVTVATSDALEQVIILGQGANRMSAADFLEDVKSAELEMRREFLRDTGKRRSYLFDHLSEDLADEMEKVRLGQDGKT